MDRLVKVDEAAVELRFRPSKRCLATFRVTSLIHTMSVAVKLTTTRPSSYSFSPDGVVLLPPLSSAVLTLVLLPTELPPLASPSDSILVGAVIAPSLRRASPASLRCFFSRPGLHIFRDASLPIRLVGPDALRSILVPGVGSTSSLSSHAIPSSSPPDLSVALLSGGGNRGKAFEKKSEQHGGRWCEMQPWRLCLRFCFREPR